MDFYPSDGDVAPHSGLGVVSLDLVVEYEDDRHQPRTMRTRLAYRPDHPYAVSLVLPCRTGAVTWTFARELLALGITEPMGRGDVQVWPCLDEHGRAVVMIELSSPDGELCLQALTTEVRPFVDRMLAAVPLGEERLDVDALLHELLA